VNVNNDAIVRIPLAYGQNAALNNFSEIQIETEPEQPPQFPDPPGQPPRSPLQSPPFTIAPPQPQALIVDG